MFKLCKRRHQFEGFSASRGRTTSNTENLEIDRDHIRDLSWETRLKDKTKCVSNSGADYSPYLMGHLDPEAPSRHLPEPYSTDTVRYEVLS